MKKYELIPQQLLYEGTMEEENFFKPQLISEEDILVVHCPVYWRKLYNLELDRREQIRSGFPHSKLLIERERRIASGTLEAAQYALKYGIGFNVSGGTHHAYSNRAEGFCLLNDIAIAASHLLRHGLIKKALIIDLDVHQGNGTAEIFKNNDKVFTFSMHGANNYPLRKETSDLDVPLKDQTTGSEYLEILQEHLPKVISDVQADLIFYLAGVDILETDQLGRMAVSMEDCKKRDKMVLQAAYNSETPLMCCMGGGYSKELKHIVEAHCNTYRLAKEIWEN